MTLATRAALLLATLTAASACGGGARDEQDLRSAVLSHLVDEVILPSLRTLDEAGHVLAAATLALETDPTASRLDAARSAWYASRQAYGRAEAVLIGPPKGLFLPAKVNTAPIDEMRIEEILAGTTTLDEAFVEGLGSTRKGFHALEYLLFDEPGASPSVLTRFTSGPGAARRRAFTRALGENLASVLHAIRDLWMPAGGDFAHAFRSAGQAGSSFATRQEALDLFVNHMIELTETIADKRLGRPLGKTSGGLPQEPGTVSERSANALREVANALLGLRDVYAGTPDGSRGSGLAALVRIAHPEVHVAIGSALDEALLAVGAIPETLLQSAQLQPDVVEVAFEAARDLKVRFVVDLTGVLGGTLTFSPFDGD